MKTGEVGLRRKALFLLYCVVASLLLSAAVLLVGEAWVRAFSDVPLLGNSRHLFVADAWGASKGNARNVEAVSFGVRVYTDEHGFRVPDPPSRAATLSRCG